MMNAKWGSVFSCILLAAVAWHGVILEQTASAQIADGKTEDNENAAAQEVRKKRGAKTPAEQKSLLQVLQKKVTVNYQEVPIDDVFDDLSKRYGFEYVVDNRGLDELGLGAQDFVITLQLSGVPLEVALMLILEQVDMIHAVREDHVEVSYGHIATLDTRIYPVGDLLKQDVPGADSLPFTIRQTVNPGAWRQTLDLGQQDLERRGVVDQTGDRLIISQSADVHREIKHFLGSSAKRTNGSPAPLCQIQFKRRCRGQ